MTGTLSSSFSNDGKAVYSFGGNDYGMALARQPDGKLIVVGYTDQNAAGNTAAYNSFAVLRVDTDGTLDATFNKVTVATGSNGNGRVLIDFGFDATATAVAIQPNGKIVVLGTSTSGDASMAIARLDADGTMDTSFSSDGKRTVSFGAGDHSGQAVAIQPDGKIVVAGYSDYRGRNVFAVARLTSAGAVDPSFCGDGLRTIDFGGATAPTASRSNPTGRSSWLAAVRPPRTTSRSRVSSRTAAGHGLLGRRRVQRHVRADAQRGHRGRQGAGRARGRQDHRGRLHRRRAPAGHQRFRGLAPERQPGRLDTTFANDGKELIDLGDNDRALRRGRRPRHQHGLSWAGTTGAGDFAVVRLQPDAGAAPPTLPTLSISDSTRKEGTGGLSVATFTVTLSATPTVPVTVAFTTASGTATEGADFTGGTEGITFLPGETDLTYGFAVRLTPDGTDELNETFVINLHGRERRHHRRWPGRRDDHRRRPAHRDHHARGQPVHGDAVVRAHRGHGRRSGRHPVGHLEQLGRRERDRQRHDGVDRGGPGRQGRQRDHRDRHRHQWLQPPRGLTFNLDELRYYLAEGATGDFWDLDIAIANPERRRRADHRHVPQGGRDHA